MSQCSSAVTKLSRLSGLCRSQCSSLAKPHSDEYTPPQHSIAGRFSRCATSVMSAASSFARWSAPEIVVVERNEPFAHGNHSRTGGVERERKHVVARYPGVGERNVHCIDQRVHVRVVRLRGEIRIVAIAVHRVVEQRRRRAGRVITIDDCDAHALRAEIDSRDDGHVCYACL